MHEGAGSLGNSAERLVVCLGYPAYLGADYFQRLTAIDSRIEVLGLPADGQGWLDEPPAQPHTEPPPWGASVAEERRAALARCHAMIALHVPANLMGLAPHLRWLHGVGAGVEQFALAGVRADRVVVTNSSGLGSASMAEFAIGRLLAIWKRFDEILEHQRRRDYVRCYGRTFMGSTVGIVGLGNIGVAIAERVHALGGRVLGLKRSFRPGMSSPAADELFGLEGLHEMLARSDAVIVAAPATKETRHLIDKAAFGAMRPGTAFMNLARGSLVDEEALIEAAKSGHLGGIALDVFEHEPLPANSPLWDLPNTAISAHSSVSVDRYLEDVFALFEENLRRFVSGENLRNQVNMQSLGFE